MAACRIAHGKICSADPYIPDPSNGQSYNDYSYVVNNPLTRIDLSGFDDFIDPDFNGDSIPEADVYGQYFGGTGSVFAGADLGNPFSGYGIGVATGPSNQDLPEMIVTGKKDSQRTEMTDPVLQELVTLSIIHVSPLFAEQLLCHNLAASLGLGPNASAPPPPDQFDDAWAESTGIGLASSGLNGAVRSYILGAGARSLGGGSVGQAMGEIRVLTNGLGLVGVSFSAGSAYYAYSNGDSFNTGLSLTDMAFGVAGVALRPTAKPLAIFCRSWLGTDAIQAMMPKQPSVLDKLNKLQGAGCL